MSEIDGLKGRVEQAVEQLSSAQSIRHGQNQNLTNLLSGLEEKFQARNVELEYCHSQIDELTQDNAQLSELLEHIIHLIENEHKSDADDPLIRASSMAATLLQDWSGDETPAEPDAEATDDSEPQELVSEDSVAMSFEDVSDEELEAEEAGAPEIEVPELVADAIAAAQECESDGDDAEFDVTAIDQAVTLEEDIQEEIFQEEIAEEIAEEIIDDQIIDEPVAADLDIPETETATEEFSSDTIAEEIEEDTEASIRAMMARLEAAALEAKFVSEDSAADAEEETSDSDPSEQVA